MPLSYQFFLSNPLTQLFQSIVRLLAAATCFRRVEEFPETVLQVDDQKVKKARNIASKDSYSQQRSHCLRERSIWLGGGQICLGQRQADSSKIKY